ncbi:MAG TPA: cyclodeaminase/cyclohydrolase family protein [Chloroflexia bacterium]|nr:cyclodeaminase/cyclohydrolase family protein [Chloroflexia bacterium]
MALIKLTVEDFVGQLASDNPTPGGGSASALAGAMAASMVEMACNLTVGREKFRDVEEQLKVVLERAGILREKLLAAVDEDTEAYNAVSQAYKLPRATDAEKAERTAAIQAALKQATEVPLGVAQAAMETSQLAVIAIQKSNPNVASDARVARLLADAAHEGAVANVEINLGSITDSDFVNRVKEELEGLDG